MTTCITRQFIAQVREKPSELPSLEQERQNARKALIRIVTYEHVLYALVNRVARDIHTNYFLAEEFSLDSFLTIDMWGFDQLLDHSDYSVQMSLSKHRELIVSIYTRPSPEEIEQEDRANRDCDIMMTVCVVSLDGFYCPVFS